MKTNKRKPLIMVGAIVMALMMVLTATFAWFSARDEIVNRFRTGEAMANMNLHETFVEPDDWKPNQTITKEVSVVNTGTAPGIVRVTFDEFMSVQAPAYNADTAFTPAMFALGETPMRMDISAHLGAHETLAAAGYIQVTTNPSELLNGLRLGGEAADYGAAQVWAKLTAAGTGTPASSTDSWDFVMFAPIAPLSLTGLEGDALAAAVEFNALPAYQAISFDRAWDNDNRTLTLTNIFYRTYGLRTDMSADWTVAAERPSNTGFSSAEALINAIPANAGNYNQNIRFNYTSAISATPTAGSWYFNADDGWFYFIGLINGGESSPGMLQSVTMLSTATGAFYSNMLFEITVKMHGIQHTDDAIAAEWANVGGNTALLTALQALTES